MLAVLLACTGGSSSPVSSPPDDPSDVTTPPPGTQSSPVPGPTWYRDVQPLVSEKCASCHQPGDIGPFSLVDYSDAKEWADAMATVTQARTMPPWPPSTDCAPLEGDRTLSQDEIDLLSAWAAAGAPEGDPADAVDTTGAAQPFQGDLDLEMAEPYTPQPQADDYRCFVVDWPETDATYVTAYQVFPGARDIVHHVILYLADSKAAHDADDAEAGPGYTCFGSAGVTATMLGSWVPGVSGVDLPAGTGVRVSPGTAMVVQVHYNTLATDPRPDRSSVSLRLADHVDRPAAPALYADPGWFVGGMDIPAGDPDVVHKTSVSGSVLNLLATGIGGNFSDPVVLSRVGLHMHLLGTEASLKLKKADGTEQCILDIPHWDFHWQGGYNLAQPVTIEKGDQLELTCHWDNSSPDAVDVNWGEGTHDEMCLTGLYLTR